MDKLTPKQRSANMRSIKSRNTLPEIYVRRLLWKAGYRYRIHGVKLPGKPDIIFPIRKKVIFVHGCFWHQHPLSECTDSRRPKSNTGYWGPKLDRNIERDATVLRDLDALGWQTLVVWDCQLREPAALLRSLQAFLD